MGSRWPAPPTSPTGRPPGSAGEAVEVLHLLECAAPSPACGGRLGWGEQWQGTSPSPALPRVLRTQGRGCDARAIGKGSSAGDDVTRQRRIRGGE